MKLELQEKILILTQELSRRAAAWAIRVRHIIETGFCVMRREVICSLVRLYDHCTSKSNKPIELCNIMILRYNN